MTRLSTIFSAWLNAAWGLMERHPRLTLLFSVGLALSLTLLIAHTGDLRLLLSLTLVTLAFFTMCVAWWTRDAAKDEKDARAKVGRLLLEFFFVVAFGLVVVAIQSDLQKKIADRSDYFNAISQLGSLSPVVRISGIDYLNKICMGEKKEPHSDIEKEESHSYYEEKCEKDDTIELLNNQVKFFTQSKSYQEDFEEEPAGDIYQIIEILTKMQGPGNIRWEGAYLRGADLSEADLQGADLEKANLQGADLREAKLQGAILVGAKLQGADLREAKLQGAVLLGTKLQEADLREANLQGAYLRRANLQEAVLYETNLQGADLSRANLQGAYLYRAKLQGANLYEANLQGARLREANLQGAYSEYELFPVDFCTRISNRIGKPTEIEGKDVIFSGGITEELWEEMRKTEWHDEEVKKRFLRKMESHLKKNPKPIYTIPDKFKNTVNTAELTEITAIIKEYNESLTDEQARCKLP